MKYRPVKQRRRLRPRWDHLLFSLLFSLSLSLSFPLCRDGIYPSSLLSPSRCPACSQSSAALTSSPLIPLPSTHSPLLHSPIFPFHRPTNVPRGGPRSSFPALTISICRAEGRGAELVRRASLSLLSLFSSPRYSPPLFSPPLFLSRGEEPGGLVSILERRRSEERKRGESKKGEGISSACFDVVVGVVGGCTRVDRWMQQSWEGGERERESEGRWSVIRKEGERHSVGADLHFNLHRNLCARLPKFLDRARPS